MRREPASRREAWPDFARACAIVLVILFHARHITWIVGFRDDGLADHAWAVISNLLMPLRMPLFFVISGVFAAGAVARRWAQVRKAAVVSMAYGRSSTSPPSRSAPPRR
ncbi:acyltransferase family protein [Novosphingobium panipatense]|uniref:acyltransferase family protein n=1 Tax=Novosphingobium panipatense TaxID=428991 RepID=UPI0039A3B6BF